MHDYLLNEKINEYGHSSPDPERGPVLNAALYNQIPVIIAAMANIILSPRNSSLSSSARPTISRHYWPDFWLSLIITLD